MPLTDTTNITTAAITEALPGSDHAPALDTPDATAVAQHLPSVAGAGNVQSQENPPVVNKPRATKTGKAPKRAREGRDITNFFYPVRKSNAHTERLTASGSVRTPDATHFPTASAPGDPIPGGSNPAPASGPPTSPEASPAAAALGQLPFPLRGALADPEGLTASVSVLFPDVTHPPTASAPGGPIPGGSDPVPANAPPTTPEASPAVAQLGQLPSPLPGFVGRDMPTDVPGMLRAIFLQNNGLWLQNNGLRLQSNLILAEGRQRQTANAEHFNDARNDAEKQTRMIMDDQEARHGETVQHFNTLNQRLRTVGASPLEPNEDPIADAEGVLPSHVVSAMNAARAEGVLVRSTHTMVTSDFAPYFKRYMEKVHNFEWRIRRGPKQALDRILQAIYGSGGRCLRQPLPHDHPAWKFHPKSPRYNCIPLWEVRKGFKAS